MAATIARAHHERFDVGGYPAVLAGALVERLGTGGLAELKVRFETMVERLPRPGGES